MILTLHPFQLVYWKPILTPRVPLSAVVVVIVQVVVVHYYYYY